MYTCSTELSKMKQEIILSKTILGEGAWKDANELHEKDPNTNNQFLIYSSLISAIAINK